MSNATFASETLPACAKSLTYQFEFSRDDEVVARGRVSVACCIPDPVKGFTAIAIPPIIADQIQVAPE